MPASRARSRARDRVAHVRARYQPMPRLHPLPPPGGPCLSSPTLARLSALSKVEQRELPLAATAVHALPLASTCMDAHHVTNPRATPLAPANTHL